MNNLSFNIEKFIHTKRDDTLDLSFISSNIKRRLSLYDKHILYLINSCLDENTENIVLSSQFGETKRLLNLIAQHEELNESSPMMFSGSVHNYPLGQITMLNQRTIPTVAVSAGELSFINGLVTAVSLPQNNIIYCYADDMENDIIAICFKINKSKSGNHYIIKREDKDCPLNLKNTVSFFENKETHIEINEFSIERE